MMKSYGTLVKYGNIQWDEEDKRVIDSNERVQARIQEIRTSMQLQAGYDEDFSDGFSGGLDALDVSDLLGDDDSGIIRGERHLEMDRGAEMEQQALRMRAEAEEYLEQARQELEQARNEADQIRQQAVQEAEDTREQGRQSGYQDGYQEGIEKAEAEARVLREDITRERTQMQEEYEATLDELEPKFIEALTGIYEHLFHVELHSYRDILLFLIQKTLRKIDGGNNYLLHVSQDDYPYVSMRKKQLADGFSMANITMEIVEDTTLSKNDCLIETANGIFDCSVDAELAELGRKLRLLSYDASMNYEE